MESLIVCTYHLIYIYITNISNIWAASTRAFPPLWGAISPEEKEGARGDRFHETRGCLFLPVAPCRFGPVPFYGLHLQRRLLHIEELCLRWIRRLPPGRRRASLRYINTYLSSEAIPHRRLHERERSRELEIRQLRRCQRNVISRVLCLQDFQYNGHYYRVSL